MKIENPCNLEVPTGATPMTIADAILRECDREILEEVLYYIDCFLNKHGMKTAQEEMHEADERLLNSNWGDMEVSE